MQVWSLGEKSGVKIQKFKSFRLLIYKVLILDHVTKGMSVDRGEDPGLSLVASQC